MKKGVLIIVCAIVACMICFSSAGCSDKKPTVVADSDSVQTDSLEAITDTLDQIIAEAPMPKAADELFDDFFFNFAANRKLQMKRIVFPLPVVNGSDTTFVPKKRWKMEHFFMHQDFYTLIFDNLRQMNVVKDTTIGHVVVERINLPRRHVRQYVFDRMSGQWMMTTVVNTTMHNNQNASFLSFYHKFVNDTTFQVASINDPLEFTGPNPDDDFGSMEGILAPEQWLSFAPELPNSTIYNILYGQKYSESNQKIFVIRGIANGLETELTFRRKGGHWKLMKLIM
ncbi:DUF4348 domain-containing protein [Prevotella sp.]|uniref:DUF4348 domain-containing protein n=1 Tax=Prevotella sp. TaxID=59823 RepID=UPI0026655749